MCVCAHTRAVVCVCALREMRAKANVTKCLQMLNQSEGYTSVHRTAVSVGWKLFKRKTWEKYS